jgi:cytochrome c biogenesis protein CcmG/thiol:disulfide interchange protein DsbE
MFLANAHLITVYGVDFRDTPQNAKKFLIKHGDPFKAIAVDDDGRIGLILGINTIPETFLVDKHGKVRDEIIGPITPIIWFDRLKPEIEAIKNQEH